MYSTHFLWALCLSATTSAYVIDTTSCNLVAQAFLAEKLTCAFDMATNVVTELRGPIRQEVQTLMDHLWAPTFYPTPQEAILCTQCLGLDEVQFCQANYTVLKVASVELVRETRRAQTTSSTELMAAIFSFLEVFRAWRIRRQTFVDPQVRPEPLQATW